MSVFILQDGRNMLAVSLLDNIEMTSGVRCASP